MNPAEVFSLKACHFWKLFGCLLFSVLLGAHLVCAESRVIEMRADEWLPFNGEADAEKPGYMIEVARMVFAAAGYSVNYRVVPWSRALQDLSQGKIHAVVGATREETPEAIFPEEELGVAKDAFFTLADSSWTFRDLESLAKRRIGLIADYSYGTSFDSYFREHKSDKGHLQVLSGHSPLEQNIHKLQERRIDCVLSTPQVFWARVDALGLDRHAFREAGILPEIDSLFIVFSSKDPRSKEYAGILSDGIRSLRASGRLAEILSRYQLSDWKK